MLIALYAKYHVGLDVKNVSLSHVVGLCTTLKSTYSLIGSHLHSYLLESLIII